MEWATSTCPVLAPEAGAALSIACAVLILLVVTLIALGFGPLRARLGWPSSPLAPRAELDSDTGLLGTWRLYHQIERSEQHREQLAHAQLTITRRTYGDHTNGANT